MSFTSDVKKELTSNLATTGALLALVRMNGSVGIFNGLTLSITTENAGTAKYIYQMLRELYDVHAEIRVHQKTTLSKNEILEFYSKKLPASFDFFFPETIFLIEFVCYRRKGFIYLIFYFRLKFRNYFDLSTAIITVHMTFRYIKATIRALHPALILLKKYYHCSFQIIVQKGCF